MTCPYTAITFEAGLQEMTKKTDIFNIPSFLKSVTNIFTFRFVTLSVNTRTRNIM
jgi:hypothetical protein